MTSRRVSPLPKYKNYTMWVLFLVLLAFYCVHKDLCFSNVFSEQK